MLQKWYCISMSAFFKFIGIFVPVNPYLVLVNAYGGRRYNDSPKVITEYLYSHQEYRKFLIVWAFERPDKFDIPFKKIKIDTPAYFITALRAKYWISCVNIERGLHFKKQGTRYLNTWHGTPFKFIGGAVKNRNDFDFSNVDVLCYAGNFEKNIYIRDLGAREQCMLLSGLPRNDGLYQVTPERVKAAKRGLDIPEDKKVILYAPTWRENSKENQTGMSPPVNTASWAAALKDAYIVLFRSHYFITGSPVQCADFLRDVSEYPEINDLLAAADILVSDYSAVIFDYSILERPFVLFVYDYDEYAADRGLYIDLQKELPGRLARTEEALIQKIKTMNYAEECGKTRLFKNKYLQAGGNAAEMCVKALFQDEK
jgi:CDP-glycerol glycerophosphotransferase